jgi:hypothetical protein
VQRTLRRLAEIGCEQDQGDDDEQSEDRPAPSNLFVMHGVRVSIMLLRTVGLRKLMV